MTARFPLQDRYDLLLDGTWTDITGYVYDRDPVTITRGRGAEAQEAAPCEMTLTLDNRDGRFSARNPVGAYYGLIGRNTQIRASLPAPRGYLRMRDTGTGVPLSCPSAAALNVGDLDVRIDLDVNTWGGGNACGKYNATGGQCSWFLDLSNEYLYLVWSPDGTDAARIEAASTVPVPTDRRRVALRATLDVNNGSGGWTARFYEADEIAGPWRQLGDLVTGTPATTIAASTAPLEVGDLSTVAGTGPDGRLWAFELRNGINGSLVAAPDIDAQTPGDTSFADAHGNTWTVAGDAELDDRDYRFHGEVASWPGTWAVSGDAYVTIKASGIKRRLTQNAPPARSPMRREFANPARQSIVAYWPMEDGQDADQIAAAGDQVDPLRIGGAPSIAAYTFWTASDPLPTMGTGSLSGRVPSHDFATEASVRLFVAVAANPAAETSLLHLQLVGGTLREWEIRLTTAGSLRTLARDLNGVAVVDTTVAFAMASRGFTILDVELAQDGADIDWRTLVLDFTGGTTISDTIPGVSTSGTLAGQTFGDIARVAVGRDAGLGDVAVGHLTVADSLDAYAATAGAIVAWNGENPTTRMDRLCAEEGIPFTRVTRGRTGNFVLLGDQLNKTVVELLGEAADSDLGILYEPRDQLGFAYRSRMSLYNQAPAVTLDYSARQVAGDLTPVDDDRGTVNALTLAREAGSSVHVEQTTGRMSTADPPDGTGRYPDEQTVSLLGDDQLPDQAAWRLHLGTVDEARYPELTVNLRATGITDAIADQVLALDVGDRIAITGMPDGAPPDDASLLVQGYTETLQLMQHEITFTLAPASPWQGAIVEAARYDTAGSSLTAPVTATATALPVTSLEGWTTNVADLPFDIRLGGERCTVTAVTGAGTSQTLTVTRSVNGISKPHTAGTGLSLWDPTYYAL